LLLERKVALKVFRPGKIGAPRKFLEEARAAAALNHPNVCTIFAVDESDGISMIVMEYVGGHSLRKRLESGKLPLEDAKNIARQIALGMAAAHAAHIVHGDLKPGNIMITDDDVIKIMDFGLAHKEPRASSTDETTSWETADPGGLSGTPEYMSPEQARSEAAVTASDVFSLGLILYEMVSGQKAVRGGSLLEVLRRIDTLEGEQYAHNMPEPLATILRRTLKTNPQHRDITMIEIAELLEV
jgi:serine/threonine protein kinase